VAEPGSEKPSRLANLGYHGIGLAFLFLNKIRHSIRGYRTPRTFPITEFQQAIEYDLRVVDHWLAHLETYAGHPVTPTGRTILELGPGADLGVGLMLLMKGARKYNALDAHNLVQSVPDEFYDQLFRHLEENVEDERVGIDFLRSQLELTRAGRGDRLNYVVREDFDLAVFKEEEVDLVFSQAAFEHFDDVEKTIQQLSQVVVPGAILIAEVDLQTHTRWIRDRDPLNIYRYSDFIYDLFRFSGSPNRIRPAEYENILERHGWGEIQVRPLTRLEPERVASVRGALSGRFRDHADRLDYLNIMLCARKP
jgi:SAM-dependent methyltransferase